MKKIIILLFLCSCGKSAIDNVNNESKDTVPIIQEASILPKSCGGKCQELYIPEFYRVQKMGPQSLSNGFCPEGSECANTPKFSQKQFETLNNELERVNSECKAYCSFCESKDWSKDSTYHTTPTPTSKSIACDPKYFDSAISLYGYF